jgi:zinc/manganese transport system permease protein
MFELLVAPFTEFSFMQRALVGCLAISISAAPIGVFLMLRRMSLTGDVMAHAILPGAAVGFMVAGLSIGAMTIGGIVAGCAVALLSGFTNFFSNILYWSVSPTMDTKYESIMRKCVLSRGHSVLN